jgi:DNA-binding NtrC family response regulator
MKGVFAYVETIAPFKIHALVVGETGVGKEVVAWKLHTLSERRAKQLQVINCAGIPSELLEYELFGIVDRAVPGVAARIGIFRLAHGSTLFLDEITEMHLELQAKILRAIREGTIRVIGLNEPVKVDVRIVAATNRDPEAAVSTGRLRRDLLIRLSAGVVRIPPLRERREDIPALVSFLVLRHQPEFPLVFQEVADSVMARLNELPLLGNVAELENFLFEAMAFASHEHCESLELRHFRREVREPTAVASAPGMPASPGKPKLTLDETLRELIIEHLVAARWNVTQAAKSLGVTRGKLYRLMKRLKITRPGSG